MRIIVREKRSLFYIPEHHLNLAVSESKKNIPFGERLFADLWCYLACKKRSLSPSYTYSGVIGPASRKNKATVTEF